jgi:hypothetical protein
VQERREIVEPRASRKLPKHSNKSHPRAGRIARGAAARTHASTAEHAAQGAGAAATDSCGHWRPWSGASPH